MPAKQAMICKDKKGKSAGSKSEVYTPGFFGESGFLYFPGSRPCCSLFLSADREGKTVRSGPTGYVDKTRFASPQTKAMPDITSPYFPHPFLSFTFSHPLFYFDDFGWYNSTPFSANPPNVGTCIRVNIRIWTLISSTSEI
jgi:hypothetical protein